MKSHVKKIYHRPHAKRFDKELQSNDCKLDISGNLKTWVFDGSRIWCGICGLKEEYRPRSKRIENDNHVAFDQLIQKCVSEYNRRGWRNVNGVVVCKDCLQFCSECESKADMEYAHIFHVLTEMREWMKDGITPEMARQFLIIWPPDGDYKGGREIPNRHLWEFWKAKQG